jgi:hypothetical protein
MSEERARQIGRRESLRSGIPDHVPIPKFLTTEEIAEIKRLKAENDGWSWEEATAAVIAKNNEE